MDILNNYEVISYKANTHIKYTNDIFDEPITVHYLNGQIHRDGDLPAIYTFEGDVFPERGEHFIEFYKHGKLHRENNKPAIINFYYGELRAKHWYVNGLEHNDNGNPSSMIIKGDFYADLNTGLYNWKTEKFENSEEDIDGELDPHPDYDCECAKWKVNGKFHRENDLPALITDTEVAWYKNGVKYREAKIHMV